MELSYAYPFQGLASGQEILTISPITNSIFDSKGGWVNLSLSQSNTIMKHKESPEITRVSIGGSNEPDIQFSEGVYEMLLQMLQF